SFPKNVLPFDRLSTGWFSFGKCSTLPTWRIEYAFFPASPFSENALRGRDRVPLVLPEVQACGEHGLIDVGTATRTVRRHSFQARPRESSICVRHYTETRWSDVAGKVPRRTWVGWR